MVFSCPRNPSSISLDCPWTILFTPISHVFMIPLSFFPIHHYLCPFNFGRSQSWKVDYRRSEPRKPNFINLDGYIWKKERIWEPRLRKPSRESGPTVLKEGSHLEIRHWGREVHEPRSLYSLKLIRVVTYLSVILHQFDEWLLTLLILTKLAGKASVCLNTVLVKPFNSSLNLEFVKNDSFQNTPFIFHY